LAATLPSGFAETEITNALTNPTAMVFAPDGRLFVSEQGGALRVVKNDTLLSTPFVTLSVDSSGERGLLGVAFDPDFSTNQFVYVYHTTSTAPIHNRIVRFTANGDVAEAGSMVVLLDLDNLNATNHNGGGLHFGPDGKLYASAGENANSANAQTLTNLLGKILRLNPDGTIPSDNPFYGTATGANRAIWALGLRNPFTFAFQPGTGRMLINDVGENSWEEIDDGITGANYGWPQTEGPNPPGSAGVTYPIFYYGHSGGAVTGCAITGGAFYNPPSPTFPAAYQGKYFFSDYCTGFIRVLNPADGTDTGFATGLSAPVDLQVSASGDLYYLARGSGLFRVRYTANQAPLANGQACDQLRIEAFYGAAQQHVDVGQRQVELLRPLGEQEGVRRLRRPPEGRPERLGTDHCPRGRDDQGPVGGEVTLLGYRLVGDAFGHERRDAGILQALGRPGREGTGVEEDAVEVDEVEANGNEHSAADSQRRRPGFAQGEPPS
jgi:glucose/arabinose dehydrogenase